MFTLRSMTRLARIYPPTDYCIDCGCGFDEVRLRSVRVPIYCKSCAPPRRRGWSPNFWQLRYEATKRARFARKKARTWQGRAWPSDRPF